MLKRKITKVTTSVKKLLSSGKNTKKLLMCKLCDSMEVEVAFDTVAVTCSRCVQLMLPPPDNYIKKEKSDKPRGWHFKSYFEHEGIVYSKGIEVTDADEIERLKKEVGLSETPKKIVKKKTAKKRGRKNARNSK